MTEQGNPRAIFKRAVEHGNARAAEMAARDMGNVTLAESLTLTALVVQKDPGAAPGTRSGGPDSIVKTEANPQCQLPSRSGGS